MFSIYIDLHITKNKTLGCVIKHLPSAGKESTSCLLVFDFSIVCLDLPRPAPTCYGLSCVCPSEPACFSEYAKCLQWGQSAATQCVNAEALPQQELGATFTGVFKLIQAKRERLNKASGSLDAANSVEAQALLTVLWTVRWPDAHEASTWNGVSCAHSQPEAAL